MAGAVAVIVGGAALAARILGADDDGRSGSSAVTADPAGADGPVSSVGADAPAASAGAATPEEAPASSQTPESSTTIHPAVVAYCDAVADYVQNQGSGQVVVNQTYGGALNDAVQRVVKAQGRLTAADFDANAVCNARLQEVYDRWTPNG